VTTLERYAMSFVRHGDELFHNSSWTFYPLELCWPFPPRPTPMDRLLPSLVRLLLHSAPSRHQTPLSSLARAPRLFRARQATIRVFSEKKNSRVFPFFKSFPSFRPFTLSSVIGSRIKKSSRFSPLPIQDFFGPLPPPLRNPPNPVPLRVF